MMLEEENHTLFVASSVRYINIRCSCGWSFNESTASDDVMATGMSEWKSHVLSSLPPPEQQPQQQQLPRGKMDRSEALQELRGIQYGTGEAQT
jgi:hypothetical protein